jgi:hypothetical protein
MTDAADIAEASVSSPSGLQAHVFACYTQRPPGHPRGSCGGGRQPLWDRLGKAIETEGLAEIGFTASGCLGFCKAGPRWVYPEGVWYRPTTPGTSTKSSPALQAATGDRLSWF